MRAIRTDQAAIEADSVRGLARKLDLPAEVLEATVGRYNEAASREPWNPMALDGRSTRGLLPPKSNWAMPLERAPFFAYPIICSVVFTYGGVKVTPRGEVVNSDGDMIRGLYAAGEVIGMYYGSYLGSTSVLKALVFGRIAGVEAAGALRRA
jgi:tricarballylate dehydrogenase